MVDKELEKQGVFDVFYIPPQNLNKLNTNLESLKENIEHVGLLSRICAINPQQKVKSTCILEMHNTIMRQLVFD
jgi:hypothetical protein